MKMVVLSTFDAKVLQRLSMSLTHIFPLCSSYSLHGKEFQSSLYGDTVIHVHGKKIVDSQYSHSGKLYQDISFLVVSILIM